MFHRLINQTTKDPRAGRRQYFANFQNFEKSAVIHNEIIDNLLVNLSIYNTLTYSSNYE